MVSGISSDNEAFLERLVALGQYPSREAAVDDAIRLLRQNSTAKEPTNAQNMAGDWGRRLKEWSESHPQVTHVVDDSRESIYEGRGE
jgi:Arc/MetJ-type ribon-helix-helix transcriptional regulator